MNTIAERIIQFNAGLKKPGSLPPGICVMNPFDDARAKKLSSAFYNKYYNDNNSRYLILGINPGRFGAGITGIPFTDPKRAIDQCGLPFEDDLKHEPSSVFIYEMISAYGGPEAFYRKFYINSVCPLGFTFKSTNGKEVNYNYYDSIELCGAVRGFIIENIKKQIALGVHTHVCFCLGTGHNFRYLQALNKEYTFFKSIIALEHPRYVIQYKSKSKQKYIDKYIDAFRALPG
jgi:hypothetical protein